MLFEVESNVRYFDILCHSLARHKYFWIRSPMSVVYVLYQALSNNRSLKSSIVVMDRLTTHYKTTLQQPWN